MLTSRHTICPVLYSEISATSGWVMPQRSCCEQQKGICTGRAAAGEPNALLCLLSSAPRLLWPSVLGCP